MDIIVGRIRGERVWALKLYNRRWLIKAAINGQHAHAEAKTAFEPNLKCGFGIVLKIVGGVISKGHNASATRHLIASRSMAGSVRLICLRQRSKSRQAMLNEQFVRRQRAC